MRVGTHASCIPVRDLKPGISGISVMRSYINYTATITAADDEEILLVLHDPFIDVSKVGLSKLDVQTTVPTRHLAEFLAKTNF